MNNQTNGGLVSVRAVSTHVVRITPTEALINLADAVLYPKNVIIEAKGSVISYSVLLARIDLAIKLKHSNILTLRAISEDWSYERIFREIY